jgi:hypothetical protein
MSTGGPSNQPPRRHPARRRSTPAIALASDLPVHAANPEDFAGIDGLTVIPVP